MSTPHAPEPTHLTFARRLAEGKHLRKGVPRSAHAPREPAADRPDPVALLEASAAGRVPELLPIRYARMLASPFAFLRGSAGVMALDLAGTPSTGVHVPLCGDCHLMNFGGFGTPERNFVFDLTDFDETLPGPWEWDVKRLATSVVAAARSVGMAEHHATEAALACVRSYRVRTREYAAMNTLDTWYSRVEGQALLELLPDGKGGPHGKPTHQTDPLVAKLTEVVDGQRRFRDNPPLVFHPPGGGRFEQDVRHFLHGYRATLQEDRRALLSRFRVVDLAMKVVGVGSVGTRCAILLLVAADDDVLILQYKEAGPSVLEPYAGKSKYPNHGQRVVCGQRLLQSASDLFLGWSREEGRDFYFRQLRDMKTTARVDGMTGSQLVKYAELCGWALARAHAKAGDPVLVAGYLGRGEAFDGAVAAFARAYADQTERDYGAMRRAVREGRLPVEGRDRDKTEGG